MKRILLTTIGLGLCAGMMAQNASRSIKTIKPKPGDKPVPAQTVFTTGNEMPLTNPNQVTNAQQHSSNRTAAVTNIGCTTYDLVSNAAMPNRILNVGGNVGAVWTTSSSGDLAAADRGSGYNYFTGGSWGTPSSTCARIETVRTGWPNYAVTASGTEYITSHISGQPLHKESRNTAGSGSWTPGSLPNIGPPEVLWGRTTSGGANGNSLHSIAITLPVANQGSVYNGLNGCPLYYRSEDGGATYNINGIQLPGVDSLTYNGWSADAYALDANGSTIAITHGQITEDWAMWKSTDNGTTWTKTIVQDFPFTKYAASTSSTDIDGDGIGDTILTVDHKVAVLVDNNGMVHCWAGAIFVLDENAADSLGLFLSTDALLYWNESMGSNPPVVIASAPDYDGDGSAGPFAADGVPRYGNGGFTSQPDAAIDPNGEIVVSFVCPIENTATGTTGYDFSFRNAFLIASSDNGASWGNPYRIDSSDFDEKVFPMLSRNIVNGCVDVMWMQDALPGIAVQPPVTGDQNSHPFGNNDIMHDCISLSLIPTGVNQPNNIDSKLFAINPNPTSGIVNLTFITNKNTTASIKVFNLTGQAVISSLIEVNGKTIHSLDLSKLPNGIYAVSAIVDGKINSQTITKQ